MALGLLFLTFLIGSWKVVRDHQAQLVASAAQDKLQNTVDSQLALLEKQNESLNERQRTIEHLNTMLTQNQKFNMSDHETVSVDEPLRLEWNYPIGHIEILKSSCLLQVNLRYEKTTDYMKEDSAIAGLVESFESTLSRFFGPELQGAPISGALRAVFQKSAPLQSGRSGGSFGVGDIIDVAIIGKNLSNDEEVRNVPMMLYDSFIVEIRPDPKYNNRECDITFYCLQSERSRSCVV